MPATSRHYKHFEVGDLCVDLLKDCQKRLPIRLFIYTYFYDYHMPNNLFNLVAQFFCYLQYTGEETKVCMHA